MTRSRNCRGIFLFETLLLMQLVFWGMFWGHITIIKLWRTKLAALQEERLPYDGEKNRSTRISE
ncbi:MAG: hypothetical protein EBR01_03405 [Proteobacteria bacterium]|nr:hypothetical protein [Pseudomonadota bacterium]